MKLCHKLIILIPATGLALFLLVISPQPVSAQSDDFNDGNDTGWTHYSLTDFGIPYGGTTFTFPDDGSGGKAYRISAAPTGDDPIPVRNARGGSYRADVTYTGRFSARADLLAWNTTWGQASGLLFYTQNIIPAQTIGYSATYAAYYKNAYISQLISENPTTVGQLADGSVVLDPARQYRLVVSTHDGYTYLFQLFDKAEPNSPWPAVIGQDNSYSSGVCGVFVFEQNYPSSTQGGDATFDNYVATVPAVNAMPAIVTDLSPTPAGKAIAIYPTITVGILDRDTLVDTTSIVLSMDDLWIPNASLTLDTQVHRPNNPSSRIRDFNGATVTYAIPTLLPWGSKHTNVVAFKDNLNNWQTNTWTWTAAYPYLFASNSLPIGSLSVRGFDARMVQSDNNGADLENSLARALQQLAIPPTIPVDRTATSIVQVLNWNKEQDPPSNVPGLCKGTYINIAVESLAYLELSAGVHRFHIKTDDRSGIYSGANLEDPAALALWENTGSTADTTFEFVVEAAGLYPVRSIWEETGGSAVLNLYSVNLGDLSEVLINDPADPAGVVKAWYPLICRSASSVAGPYTVNAAAVNVLNKVDLTSADCSPTVLGQMVSGGTFTVPLTAEAQFYRLDGPRKTKITSINKSGSNVVMQYEVQ